MPLLDGKVAIITGGTSGVGYTAAEIFAKEGAKVVIVGRRREPGEEAQTKLRAMGHEVLFVSADISVEADVQRMVTATLEAHGKIDVAFLNSGVSSSGASIVDMTEEDFTSCLNNNLKGPFLCLKHLIPHLTAPGGTVVLTSSIASLSGTPNRAAYASAKAGLNMLARAAAMEVAPSGVRVNVVCPAGILTPMAMAYAERVAHRYGGVEEALAASHALHPLGRMATPKDIADVALFLASDASRMMTGQIVSVDGGMSAGSIG